MFILILVFISGYGQYPFTVMQEFTTSARCEVAKNQVRGAYQRAPGGGYSGQEKNLITAVCVEK